jgi:N-glycosylase/DNA lyase
VNNSDEPREPAPDTLRRTVRRFRITVDPAHFDLEACVSSGQMFRWQEQSNGGWLGIEGDNWYLVRTEGSSIDIYSNADSESFKRLFRLDEDAEGIEKAILARAPELQPYMLALRGLRVTHQSDPVETFFTFLCTPNNNIKRITQMVGKLAAYGPPILTYKGEHHIHRFPEPEIIAAIPEEGLRTAGFGYRARTIPHLAHQLLQRGGREWLNQLKQAPYKEAHNELKAMTGIGPKLADCIALFGLHHDEAVPVDTHIWQAMVRLYFPEWKDKALTEQRYYAAADFFRDRLGNLAGWAHQYLFYENVLNWRSRTGTSGPIS